MTLEERLHYQRLCSHTCPLCLAEAQAQEHAMSTVPWFEDTGKFLQVFGRERPVLRSQTGWYYVGEGLSIHTPDGGAGRVWGASSISKLQATVYVAERPWAIA